MECVKLFIGPIHSPVIWLFHFHHAGDYPIEINLSVSPKGNYSLTIFIEDDEGFEAASTVHYSINNLISTGWLDHHNYL